MDPVATINRILEALRDDDKIEARAAFEDLSKWASEGGFVPTVINEFARD